MRVAIITSARRGTASHHLSVLAGSPRFTIAQVILIDGGHPSKGMWRRKLKKLWRIGPLGALIGVRMRRWYDQDVKATLPIEDLGALCQRQGIAYDTTPAMSDMRTVELLRASQADIAVSLGNGYIPSKVFSIPPLGMLNIHHELLPERQNAQPVIWAIYEGERRTGYTIHRIDKGIDTGTIVLREEVAIAFKGSLRATVAHTMAALLAASASGLRRVLEDLPRHLAEARPQGPGRKRSTPSFGEFLRIRRNHRRLAAERSQAGQGS
ncbi:MAG: hypothetical protein IPM46_03500 [Flavobacteriales bacterium]|nr:hypothetical protein [Flavobacteriales bacterium]